MSLAGIDSHDIQRGAEVWAIRRGIGRARSRSACPPEDGPDHTHYPVFQVSVVLAGGILRGTADSR